jgi:hypothetical protein
MNVSKPSAGSDRRQHRRYRVNVPLGIDAGPRSGRVGVTQDASVEGLLFNTRSKFEPGEEVKITIFVPGDDRGVEETVTAHIIRTESVPAESQFPWRYLTAVRFSSPKPHIELHLQRLEASNAASGTRPVNRPS